MRNRFSRRQIGLVLVAGVLVSCGAMIFSGGSAESGVIEPVTRTTNNHQAGSIKPGAAAATAALPKTIAPPARANLDQTGANNLFASNSWTPPPPPPPKELPPPPPPPPTAPPMPFNFVGLLQDQAKPTAFLAKDDQLLLVTTGDTVEGIYRIDSVSAKEIVLTYLPLNQRQSILISGGL
ncbi:hypothetical protein SAMN04515618_1087 [Collimonas sp. OK307]|uniref:hypothetical protein n=1 Tax=Collimonas sp. OK307 TaxID=1801620 RepID=UPI0008F29221|nr:hypothetical protein [Collimonas sp. OK307]SFI02037.1 hypothetical protein SAMN04515618_1087 [Collimonas sp. OK307]